MILAFLFGISAHAAPSAFLADLELFRQRSLAVRTTREQLSAASSGSLSRLLQVTPRLTVAGGREGAKLQGAPQVGSYDTRDWYWRAGLDWNLFRGGGDFLSWRAAKNSEQGAALAAASEELKTELAGANVIFKRLYLRDTQGAQEELLKLKQETLRLGRDRFRQGKIPLQDVAKMEVDLSQQRNVARQSEIDLAENEAAFRAFFVDELRTNDWPFSGKEAAEPLDPKATSFEQLRLRRAADALDLTWRSAVTRHAPSLDLNLSLKDYQSYGQGNKLWSGTLELSFPLWSRWELKAASAQAYADSVRAQDEADQNAREEELRREFLRRKVSLSRASLEEARANLDRADQLYRDMLRSFQLGRLSTNDLFLEQDRKIRAILSYSQARLDYHSSVVEACALRGQPVADCLR